MEEGAVRGDRVTRGAWDVLTVVLPAGRHDTWRRERGEGRREGLDWLLSCRVKHHELLTKVTEDLTVEEVKGEE